MSQSLDELSREVAKVQPRDFTPSDAKNDVIRWKITLNAISDLKTAADTAYQVMSLELINKHFSIPQTVSSIFTGQSDLLVQLKELLFDAPALGEVNKQRRFVIYGMGGGGKTQLCCKFAMDNRHR
jgi:hypothetical protein